MLRVDYEALAAGSKTLQDQGAIFEECIDRMRQVIEGLQMFGKQIQVNVMWNSSKKQNRDLEMLDR